MSDTILGYNRSQVEAVTYELQSTVMDLITISESEGTEAAVDVVVTGLAVRIAILEELITPEDAQKLVEDSQGNFVAITQELQSRALAKLLAG
jgi:hypothetical protein